MTLPSAPNALDLKVTQLTAQVEGKLQVRQVTFHVPAGGALAIAGPVGSGKSALLWAINGLLAEVPGALVSGAIEIAGTPISRIPTAELRKRVGLLITAPLARTPFAEVAMPIHGSPIAESGARVERVLRLVGLWHDLRDRLHKPYNPNNPVLLRLLTLARTMVQEPGILLLDDPTRGLDSMGRARFEDAVAKAAAESSTTLLWATREPDQAGRVADNMAFLCAGEIVEMGPVASLFERPADPRTESFLTGDYQQLQVLASPPQSTTKGGNL